MFDFVYTPFSASRFNSCHIQCFHLRRHLSGFHCDPLFKLSNRMFLLPVKELPGSVTITCHSIEAALIKISAGLSFARLAQPKEPDRHQCPTACHLRIRRIVKAPGILLTRPAPCASMARVTSCDRQTFISKMKDKFDI